jgi:hypothetical protein
VGRTGARYDQAAFLAGALAGLISPTGRVGLIVDTAAEPEPTAFLHGLRYLCVRCELVSLEPARASVDAFRAEAVDVVGVLPGPAAGTAAQALAGEGFWLVLVNQPGATFAAGQLAARVVFEPAPMLIPALEALLSGAPGQTWPYSLELESIRVVDIHPRAISPGRQEALQEILRSLAAGTLDPGAPSPTP